MRLQKLLVYFIVALSVSCASTKNKSSSKKEENISKVVDSVSTITKETKKDTGTTKTSVTIVREKLDSIITIKEDSSKGFYVVRGEDSVKTFTNSKYDLTIGTGSRGIWYNLILKEQKIPVKIDKEIIHKESQTSQSSQTTKEQTATDLSKTETVKTEEQATTKTKETRSIWWIVALISIVVGTLCAYYFTRNRDPG